MITLLGNRGLVALLFLGLWLERCLSGFVCSSSVSLFVYILCITKACIFKYTENFANVNFQIKNSDIFHIPAQNIDCGYSLEPPRLLSCV